MSTTTHERAAAREPVPRPAMVARLWSAVLSSRSLGALVSIGLGGGLAFISSIAMPRGPVTSTQAVAVILSVLVGLAAGYAMRSRWVMIFAPLAYVVASP